MRGRLFSEHIIKALHLVGNQINQIYQVIANFLDWLRFWREGYIQGRVSEAAKIAALELPTGGASANWDRAIFKGLQLREHSEGRSIDMAQTIDSTLKQGWFPRGPLAHTKTLVEYLFLVHRQSRGDLEYKRTHSILTRMNTSGLYISEYMYTHDPRIVYNISKHESAPLTLNTLFDRHRQLICSLFLKEVNWWIQPRWNLQLG